MIEGETAAQAALRRSGLVLAEEVFVAGAPLRHAFTHFTLTLTPWRASLPAQPAAINEPVLRWVRRDELDEVGLPTPVRRLLAQAVR